MKLLDYTLTKLTLKTAGNRPKQEVEYIVELIVDNGFGFLNHLMLLGCWHKKRESKDCGRVDGKKQFV